MRVRKRGCSWLGERRLWSGIKTVWGYAEEMASGFVMIYPNMLYDDETDWKKLEFEEASAKFRELQRMETLKWDKKDVWYLLFGYWYKGQSTTTTYTAHTRG